MLNLLEECFIIVVLMYLKINIFVIYFIFLKGVVGLYSLGKYLEFKDYYLRNFGMGEVFLLFYRGCIFFRC